MSVPLRDNGPGLSRRDEMTVSAGAMSEVPWGAAGTAGVVVGGADLLLHLLTGHFGLGLLGTSLSAGTVALFAVAGAGVMVRDRTGRAVRWARSNPWRFAVLPGVAAAAIVFVLSLVLGSGGFIGDAFTAIWHGAVAFAITGGVGSITAGRRKSR